MRTISDMLRKARAVVLRRGASPEDADDIVQEAFARLEAYTRVHEIRSREAFLVTAAVNIASDQARRRANAPFHPGEIDLASVADGRPQPDEILHAQERLRRAATGLEQLNPKVRRLVIARRLEGMTYAEIATQENMSVTAVEKNVARGVLFLIKWMDGW